MKKKVEDKDLSKVKGGAYPRYNMIVSYKCNSCNHKWRSTSTNCCPECQSTDITEVSPSL